MLDGAFFATQRAAAAIAAQLGAQDAASAAVSAAARPAGWRGQAPDWLREWLDVVVPMAQIVLVAIAAWLLYRFIARIIRRAGDHYQFPPHSLLPVLLVVRWLIVAAAVMLMLERLGVSATVLWTAFTGFATVGAVAFFAAWSVLSNLFCAFLIFTAGPFRVGDFVELLDTAEKPGALGRVVDINLLYTTLEEVSPGRAGALLQIPNALIFQRVVRRWKGAAAADFAARLAAADASASTGSSTVATPAPQAQAEAAKS